MTRVRRDLSQEFINIFAEDEEEAVNSSKGGQMRELTNKEEKDIVTYCMKPENTWLALAIGQIQPELRVSYGSHAGEIMITELTDEEKEFLVDYCMKPENTWLALAIGQVNPKLERRILSLFLEKLDESVKKEIERRDDLRWRTCIPKKDLEEEDLKERLTILYIMTMEYRGKDIEIHLGLYDWHTKDKHRELYMGTHEKRENKEMYWPKECLKGFLNKPYIEDPSTVDGISRLWWFCPIECHRRINTIKALSTLNDGPKIKYFTDQLVCLAEDISRELGE